jgi:plasmid segregation protein ParM
MSVQTSEKQQSTKRQVAVDVGYGFVKAVSSTGGRVCFPSLAAPGGPDLGLGGVLGGEGPGHAVKVRFLDGRKGEYLVGEAAQGSFLASGFLGAEKPADLHDLLLLTACALVGAGGTGVFPGQADLAVGLPLAFYKAQREALKARLERLSAWVAVDGEEEQYISFRHVLVIPQGVGVVFSQGLPQGRGFAGVMDVGQYTTDFLLVDLRTFNPVVEACGSVEAGCHLVVQRVAQAYLSKTGRPLPLRMERSVLDAAREGQPVPFRGKEVDLAADYEAAVRDVAATVSRQVLSAWRDVADMIGVTYLAGGGSLLLGEHLARTLPNPALVNDPVFANAAGYLRILTS